MILQSWNGNEATLKKIKRGFGSDVAIYICGEHKLSVSVGWALLAPHITVVYEDNNKIAEFMDDRYVQPLEALVRLGFDVIGAVDFAEHGHAKRQEGKG